jgi:hypothetical protein
VPKALWVRPLADDARQQLRQGSARLPAERSHAPLQWTEEEFGGLQVWDARLKQRLYQLAEDFWGDAQSRSLTRRCADRARTVAAYRFFRNPRINMQIVLGAHREAVIERMGAHPLVLVPQDTTSLNDTGHPDTAGLGPIGSKTAGGPVGLVLHHSHAFTPEGVPLGVVSAACWARDPEQQQIRREPEARESGKWLAAYRTLQVIAPQVPHTTLVGIGDRAADLFELFALARDPQSPRLLVRANRGRQRQVLTAAGLTPLWDHLGGLEVAGRLALALPRRGAQAARTAELELRYGPVTLKPPQAVKEGNGRRCLAGFIKPRSCRRRHPPCKRRPAGSPSRAASRAVRPMAIRGRKCCGRACRNWMWQSRCISSIARRSGWGGARSIRRGICGRRRILREGEWT